VTPALDELIEEWEREDPGSTDIEAPPETPTQLPEMDLTEDELPPLPPPPREQAPMGLPSEPRAEHTPRSLAPLVAGDVARKGAPRTPATESHDWKGLAQRLGLAEIGRGQSRAYEGLFANVGAQSGYRPNAHAGDAAVAVAKQPLELAKEKQGMELRDLDMASRRASLGAKAAMDDPNSMQSQKSRDMLTAAMGGTLPPGAQNWTANDVQRFVRTGAVARSAADRRQAATDAAKAQADADKAAKADDELRQMQKTWTPELEAAGKDPSTASKFDIEQVMGVVKAREGRAFTANRDDDKDVRDLSDKLGDPAAFSQKYEELMRLVKENGGEIPGLGAIEGVRQQAGVLGTLTRAVSPSSEAAIKGRKLMRQLAADYAREISGAGVSDTERRNLNAATIDVDNEDSRIALSGLETLKEMHAAKIAQLNRGYRPGVIRRAMGGNGPLDTPSGDGDPVVTLVAEDGKRQKRVKKSVAVEYVRTHMGAVIR
jgi:hypothetical protein